MNENMAKLMGLINETNRCIDNLKTETRALKEKHLENKQAQFEALTSGLREFRNVVRDLGSDVYVATKARSHYNDGVYYLRFQPNNCWIGVLSGDKYSYLGHIDVNVGALYKDRDCWYSNLRYNLDAIIDAWDRDEFERNFVIEVQKVIRRKAEKANNEYEAAKEALR